MKKNVDIMAFLALALLSAGCGSGSGGNTSSDITNTSSAYLSDTRVSGVTYTCGSDTGVTDSEGKFTYTSACSEVFFSVGGVSLGSVLTSNTLPPI